MLMGMYSMLKRVKPAANSVMENRVMKNMC